MASSAPRAPRSPADRQCGPALEGLFRNRRELPARACRFHLRCQIRHPRSARRRAFLGARNRDARGRRCHCAQGGARHARAWRAGADGAAQDRPPQLELGRGGSQPLLLPGCAGLRILRGVSRWHPQEWFFDWRGAGNRGRGRAAGLGRRSMASSTAISPRR